MPLLTWGYSPSLALRYADVLLQSDDILYKILMGVAVDNSIPCVSAREF